MESHDGEVSAEDLANLAGKLAHEIGAAQVQKILRNIDQALMPHVREGDRLKIRQIAIRVATQRAIPLNVMFGRERYEEAAYARYEVWYEAKKGYGFTMGQIGAVFDGRDHTTIMNGIRQWKRRIAV